MAAHQPLTIDVKINVKPRGYGWRLMILNVVAKILGFGIQTFIEF